MTSWIGPPASRPCPTCPYRVDVPSGVWAAEEYQKLPRNDLPTQQQPTGVFTCHQQGRDAAGRRVCAGWAGCHDGDHLLALRIAILREVMSPDDIRATIDYTCPVPLFTSCTDAAHHGLAEVCNPGPQAVAANTKIERVRGDLR